MQHAELKLDRKLVAADQQPALEGRHRAFEIAHLHVKFMVAWRCGSAEFDFH